MGCLCPAGHKTEIPSPYEAVNQLAVEHGLQFKAGFDKQYTLGNKLGSGLTGTVYKATNADGTEVAVKQVVKGSEGLRCEADYLELIHEIAVMQQLDHPHLVRLLDYYHEEDCFYLVQELMRGGELRDHILDAGGYTERIARQYVQTLVSAVKCMHDAGIVHRDIKPENILLTRKPQGVVKLSDFGFAGFLKPGQQFSDTKGTPTYMAPELEKGHEYDLAVDCWSLGVVFYILLCGRHPFPHGLNKQIRKHLRKHTFRYKFPDKAFYDLSPEAQDFLTALLEINPRRRLGVRDMERHPWLLSADVPDKVLAKTLVGLRTMMKRTVRVVQSVMRMQRLKRLSQAQLFADGASPFAQNETKANPDADSGAGSGAAEAASDSDDAGAGVPAHMSSVPEQPAAPSGRQEPSRDDGIRPAAVTASTPLLAAQSSADAHS